jgi:sorting nexin-3/12
MNSEDHTRLTSNSHLEGAMAFVRSQKCRSFGEDTTRKIYSALLTRAVRPTHFPVSGIRHRMEKERP